MATNGNEASSNSDRTLHIRFGQGSDQRVDHTLAALDRGETPAPFFEVVFHDPYDVHRVTRPQNVDLFPPGDRQSRA